MRWMPLWIAMLLVVTACAGSLPTPTAAPSAPSATATAAATPTHDHSVPTPSAARTPEGSGQAIPSLIAVPDALHPMVHRAGEEVSVKGVTLVYRGLQSRGGELYARFEVRSGSLENARLLVAGSAYDLHPTSIGDALEAGPLDVDPGEMTIGTNIVLVVGELLVVFAA